jgi:arylsulfatase
MFEKEWLIAFSKLLDLRDAEFLYLPVTLCHLIQAVDFLDFPRLSALHPMHQRNAGTKTGRRPNIVWLVIDDMGYGDAGAFGGGAAVGAATPNIDRIAREGLKLTSTYSQPTCTPTRSAILTGRLPVRTGLTRPILAGDTITKNPWADEISLAKLLSDAGYRTVLSGKWHVGEAEGMRPHDVGFDEFYGYYGAQKEITQHLYKGRYPDLVLNPERLEMLRKTGA